MNILCASHALYNKTAVYLPTHYNHMIKGPRLKQRSIQQSAVLYEYKRSSLVIHTGCERVNFISVIISFNHSDFFRSFCLLLL